MPRAVHASHPRVSRASSSSSSESDIDAVLDRPTDPRFANGMEWDTLLHIVADGSLEALYLLNRSPAMKQTYKTFRKQVLEDYVSMNDYLAIKLYQAERRQSPDDGNKWMAGPIATTPRRIILRPNDFPYNFKSDILHWVLWSTEPMAIKEVEEQVRDRLIAASAHQTQPPPPPSSSSSSTSTSTPSRYSDKELRAIAAALSPTIQITRDNLNLCCYINPPSLQTVPGLWHAQVLFRIIQPRVK